jgi:diguanylate cyclase (GGDEF)-like protein
MMDRIGQAIENSKRTQATCALIFMDLDGFKEVNDTLGHDAGDNLLKVIAIRLQECLRKSDTIARLGGDEFTVLLCNLTSSRDVERVAEKIIEVTSKPVILNGQQIQVTSSLGVTIFPTANDDVSTLLRKSDSAMYIAKKTGKNKWCMYSEAVST